MTAQQPELSRPARPWWVRAFGLLLALVLLAALAMEASPALHQAVHPDAGSSDHQCFVTLLASGAVEALAVVAVLAAVTLVCVGQFSPRIEVLLSAVAWRLLPGRAPPRFV